MLDAKRVCPREIDDTKGISDADTGTNPTLRTMLEEEKQDKRTYGFRIGFCGIVVLSRR
jgi:hypothetical protein